MRPLILGLGNELLGDDAIGILAARRLYSLLRDRADVVESALSGMALLDLFIGYQQAVIVDAQATGKVPPGTIVEHDPAALRGVAAPSPHYAGLPELLAVADQLDLEFPREIKIFAVEIADSTTIGGKPTEPVMRALDELVVRVLAQVARWEGETRHA